MREYIFRGKRVDSGEWVCGNLVTYFNKPSIQDYAQSNGEIFAVDPETVGQYTGLQDKNERSKNDIYDGSIIKINFDPSYVDKPYYIGVVRYRAEDGYPAFDLEPWIDCGMNALAWLESDSDPCVIDYEVIGNRFDNHDLLGEVRE